MTKGEVVDVSFSPGVEGSIKIDNTAIRTTKSPNTINSMRHPNRLPIKVINGIPRLIPKVLPAIITATALP